MRRTALLPLVGLLACARGGSAGPASLAPPVARQAPAEMIAVPGGRVLVGSPPDEAQRDEDEGPALEVEVEPFAMDALPVRAGDFAARADQVRAVPGARFWDEAGTPAEWPGRCNLGSSRVDHPMNCADWGAARAYCALRGLDLPTEAEWTLAAREAPGAFPWGAEFAAERVVSSAPCGARGCAGGTRAVAGDGARCNRRGLCDLSGNVWQWTRTDYRPWIGVYVRTATESGAPARPVIKGGGWANHLPAMFRLAHRGLAYPQHGLTAVGFRCVRRAGAPSP